MENKTFYFEWENNPAVLMPTGRKTYFGYFIKDNNWETANAVQIGDFFDDGEILNKGEFDKRFGGIGKKLPKLPA